MRIVHFTECYRPIQNGVVAAVDALSEALREQGHEVLCVTPNVPGYHEANADVVRVPSLPLPTPTAYRLTLPLLPQRRVAQMMRTPSIVHAHSPFVTGWLGLRLARRYGVPLVFTYHTRLEDYAHYIPFEIGATRRAALHLTRTYANAADAVIVPTPAMESHLRSLGVTARIDVVPSGIDVDFFAAGRRREELREKFGVRGGERMVLSVGRLGREKNVELAIETLAVLRTPARLVVVGDGPHRPALRAAAERAGVADRVHFALELPREQLPDAYASSDAFLFTSASETQGLVLAEAMAAGLAVVALDTPQTRDVLAGGGTVAPGDPRALAAALDAVLAGGGAVEVPASRRFERRQIAERVVAIYDSLIGAHAAAG